MGETQPLFQEASCLMRETRTLPPLGASLDAARHASTTLGNHYTRQEALVLALKEL